MKCMFCQGEMKKGVVPFHVDREGFNLTLDKVPAWVCTQCGESFFAADEVDAIQSATQVTEQKLRAVPLTRLAALRKRLPAAREGSAKILRELRDEE